MNWTSRCGFLLSILDTNLPFEDTLDTLMLPIVPNAMLSFKKGKGVNAWFNLFIY